MPELKDNETIAELWQDTDKKLESQRLPDQQSWTNPDIARGTRMIHSNDLIRRIRKMNPSLLVEDSKLCADRAGIYYVTPQGERQFTGAHFQKGWISERVLVYVDRADLPTGYELGWRTILVRLLQKGLITLAQAKKWFPLEPNQISQPFDEQVQQFKN